MRDEAVSQAGPLVSVALGVRNCENTVGLAVRSILAQSYKNWELLIASDGSTDGTNRVLESFRDERIRLFSDKESKGLAFRLNELINRSRGKYLARMDGDDFAFPDRFARQVQFLEAHPEVDLIASEAINFENEGRISGKSRKQQSHEDICRRPWSGFPLYHPTWMGRTEWFRKHQYDPTLRRSQDFELLLRTHRQSRFFCLKEPLLGYRVEQLTLGRQFHSRRNVCRILLRQSIRQKDLRLLWGVIEQSLKMTLDAVAIITGARYKVLRHRGLPVSDAEREAFDQAWAKVKEF